MAESTKLLLACSASTADGLLLYVCTGYTNAGVAAAVACVLAGLAQPSLLGLPYVLATAAAVWCWGRRLSSTPPRALLLAGQVYVGEVEAAFRFQCVCAAASCLVAVAQFGADV